MTTESPSTARMIPMLDCARCSHTADQHEQEDDEGVATRLYFGLCRESWVDPDDATMDIECDCEGYAEWVPA